MKKDNNVMSTINVGEVNDSTRDKLVLNFIQASSLLANPTSDVSHKTVFETVVQKSFNELYDYYLEAYDGDELGVKISLNIYLRNINAGTLTNHGLNSELVNILLKNAGK